MTVILDVCKARTFKICSVCGKGIEKDKKFIRLGEYPNDLTIHRGRCIKKQCRISLKYANDLIKEVLNLP